MNAKSIAYILIGLLPLVQGCRSVHDERESSHEWLGRPRFVRAKEVELYEKLRDIGAEYEEMKISRSLVKPENLAKANEIARRARESVYPEDEYIKDLDHACQNLEKWEKALSEEKRLITTAIFGDR